MPTITLAATLHTNAGGAFRTPNDLHARWCELLQASPKKAATAADQDLAKDGGILKQPELVLHLQVYGSTTAVRCTVESALSASFLRVILYDSV